ncbi:MULTISPECIES: hypothetical protein [unclassified Helicobacter]|uniref:hypothetical protein n=1 Tax=unclassified Helicobacter TaxID=2593540 RepID=UPI0012E887AA|nr:MULTISPECIES: hypothetical protein [unclassified Helicobacter]
MKKLQSLKKPKAKTLTQNSQRKTQNLDSSMLIWRAGACIFSMPYLLIYSQTHPISIST